jgi:hypothetical protein
MKPETQYLTFLVEHYALAHDTTGDKVFAMFDENNLLEYINDRFYPYHTERVENAIEDIDEHLTEIGITFP